MKKLILSFLFPFSLLFAGGALLAQCELGGQVINLQDNFGCEKAILSYEDFSLYVPMSGLPIDMEDGTGIHFSFLPYTGPDTCNGGIPIELTCLELFTLPSADCTADFEYFANFAGFASLVFFQPVTLDDSLAYHWDFGDGSQSDETLAEHVFPGQGYYEVCLTITGGGCGEVVSCSQIDLNECHAEFFYLAGDDGEISFINQSSGSFTDLEWSMGDGTVFQGDDIGSYTYSEENIYTVCLTVWNDNGCSNQFCDYVYSGPGDVCDFADCILPGDANVDGEANVYDLLPIGVGYGTEGPPRQSGIDATFGSMDWQPQYASNWEVETVNGTDYKHLDSNGDGKVDAEDVEAIDLNYEAPENIFMVETEGAPLFWLDFEWDTILIDDNTPSYIELEAYLMVSTPDLPIGDLSGFALQLDYPEEMVLQGGISVDYNDNSFFGNSNQIIWLRKDRFGEGGVLDLGFTQKNNSVNGFGHVATVNFIVIGDLIARSGETPAFTVNIKDAVAVNSDGSLLTLGEAAGSTVYIVDKTTTDTKTQWLNKQIRIYPNPASSQAIIELGDVKGQYIEVFNALGQMAVEAPLSAGRFELNTSDWDKGVYLVKIQTDQGTANKRLLVQ
ncbi:MAG TPA: T9SS type A sorting domain-containing protein [Bacteroidetes bacterium]|nr:T9SS type A sorting domain-containing protein [Bacteroidota bacterium]